MTAPPAFGQWRPIDTAPADIEVLVVWHGHVRLGVHRPRPYHSQGRQGWRVSEMPANKWTWVVVPPTHWMPLPEPPR